VNYRDLRSFKVNERYFAMTLGGGGDEFQIGLCQKKLTIDILQCITKFTPIMSLKLDTLGLGADFEAAWCNLR
jgi:hypothetical protein